MKNCNYIFKKQFHHVFIDYELIILDVDNDKFFFFNIEESIIIYDFLKNKKNENSIFLNDFINFFLKNNFLSVDVIEFYNLVGIDSHSWKDVKFYLNNSDGCLSFMQRIFVLCIFLIFFQIKGMKYRVLLLKFFKKMNKKENFNLNFANNVNKFIHDLSKYSPYQLKCLEHAFILSSCLTLFGFKCNFNIGVQKYNFASHAWVDIEGDVLGDNKLLTNNLACIFKI